MQLNLVGVAEVQATCCIYTLRQIRPRHTSANQTMEWWKHGKIEELISECEAIQKRLKRSVKTKIQSDQKAFSRLMLQGQVKKALRFVSHAKWWNDVVLWSMCKSMPFVSLASASSFWLQNMSAMPLILPLQNEYCKLLLLMQTTDNYLFCWSH